MNKHHKAILAELRKAGSSGVYNHELNKITFRYSARIKELRDGTADGFCHQIKCDRVKGGVFKFTLAEEPLTPEATAMIDAILEPAMESIQSVRPGEGRAKWEAMRAKLKGDKAKPIPQELVELKHQIISAQNWLERNMDHPRIDEALSRYEALEDKYNQMRSEYA